MVAFSVLTWQIKIQIIERLFNVFLITANFKNISWLIYQSTYIEYHHSVGQLTNWTNINVLWTTPFVVYAPLLFCMVNGCKTPWTSIWVQTKYTFFALVCLNFLDFSFFFYLFCAKNVKKHFLTSRRFVQHPKAGQNIQQIA